MNYLPWSDLANTYFPGNGELLYLWALHPFLNDLLVRVVCLFLFGVFGFSVYRICRIVGSRPPAALAATYLLIFTPLVFAQATDLWLDMSAGAFFMLALGHLLQFLRTAKVVDWCLFGVATGLFAGTKYSGPVYVALLSVAALAVIWRLRGRQWAAAALAGAWPGLGLVGYAVWRILVCAQLRRHR